MSYKFSGMLYCPIAGDRCPNTTATGKHCIFGNNDDERDEYALTDCMVYDLVSRLCASFEDGGAIPVDLTGSQVECLL